eukprot:Amastigsp_a265_249.p2 type:complete len:146 gc:universal Amastigsp_a265_249:153-590(+)
MMLLRTPCRRPSTTVLSGTVLPKTRTCKPRRASHETFSLSCLSLRRIVVRCVVSRLRPPTRRSTFQLLRICSQRCAIDRQLMSRRFFEGSLLLSATLLRRFFAECFQRSKQEERLLRQPCRRFMLKRKRLRRPMAIGAATFKENF